MDSEDFYMQDCFLGVADDLKPFQNLVKIEGDFLSEVLASLLSTVVFEMQGGISNGVVVVVLGGALYSLPITGQYLAQIS